MLLRKIEINYQNTTSLVNDLITVTSELENEKESVKRALDELNDLENYHANKGAIVDELEFRKRKIDKDIQNTEELIQNIKDFSERVQETDERLAQKFKQDIKSYAKQNSIELVSDFDKWLDKAQMALDAIGIFPLVGEVADVINGVIYLAKGDIKNAGISFISMIPEVGDTAKSVRYFDKASDILKYTDKAVDLERSSKKLKLSNATKKLDIKDIDFEIDSKKINSKVNSNVIDEKKGIDFKGGENKKPINKESRVYDPTKPMSPSNYPNPDPDYSVPPVRYEPKTIEEIKRMRKGKGPTTKATHGDRNIEAHHRGQKSVKNGGIIDDLEEYVHRRGGNHTRHKEASELTPAQRAKEIREYWKKRGYEYKLPGEE